MKTIPFKDLRVGMLIIVDSSMTKQRHICEVLSPPMPFDVVYPGQRDKTAYPDDTLLVKVEPLDPEIRKTYFQDYNNMFITDFHKIDVEIPENAELIYKNT